MKMFNLFFTALLLSLVIAPASAMMERRRSINIDQNKYPEWYKFVVKHRCSQEVEEAINRESQNIEYVKIGKNRARIFKYRRLPYFNKGDDIDRVDNTDCLENFFKQRGIETIQVAKDSLCLIGLGWQVISRAVEECGDEFYYSAVSSADRCAREERERELLIQETDYNDWHRYNVIRNEMGVLTIIDTEKMAFCEFKQPLFCGPCTFCKRRSRFKYRDFAINFDKVKQEFELWQTEKNKKSAWRAWWRNNNMLVHGGLSLLILGAKIYKRVTKS